jgi:LysM repeat protein
VTETAGHVVQSWESVVQYWGGVNATFSQTQLKTWTPATGTWAGTGTTALASMPTTPANAIANFWERDAKLFVNDNQMGSFWNSSDFEPPATTIRSWHSSIDVAGLSGASKAEGNGQTYTVQAGDSCNSLAQRFYGDQSLWYVIADANVWGGQSGAGLPGGRVFKIPNVVRSSSLLLCADGRHARPRCARCTDFAQARGGRAGAHRRRRAAQRLGRRAQRASQRRPSRLRARPAALRLSAHDATLRIPRRDPLYAQDHIVPGPISAPAPPRPPARRSR